MLATVDQIQSRADKRGISTSEWTTEDIIELIEEAQSYIEEETGQIFDNQNLSVKFFNYSGKNLNLPQYPVLGVSEVKVDDAILPADSYGIDEIAGIIQFKSGVKDSDIEIQYTGCYEPPHPVAKSVCVDLVLAMIKYDLADPNSLKSVKEGDISVTYKDEGNWLDFNTRLKSLKRKADVVMV